MSAELVIVGDEAWTREEWEADQRRRAKDRARYHLDENRRRRVIATATAWNEAHHAPRITGSLHSVACKGPTVKTGCKCRRRGTRKILTYDKPR